MFRLVQALWSSCLLALLLLASEVKSVLVGDDDQHFVFPAAQMERYSPKNGSRTLRTLHAADFSILYQGPAGIEQILDAAQERFMGFLFQQLPDFPEDYEKNPSHLDIQPLHTLSVLVATNDTLLRQNVDESYSLRIQDSGEDTVIQSKTVFGALRGLETFSQLVEFGWIEDDTKDVSFSQQQQQVFIIPNTPLVINDFPDYPYRGLLIDTARHYLPMNLILSNLDAMSMNKMNVLHWHLTDSQSFPYQSHRYPELANKGAFLSRRTYTLQDVRRVVHEGYLRGIRVIPEFDMPGHTQAIANSHPEFMSKCPFSSEPLNPTSPEVYKFIQGLYEEIATVFPDDFIHVGGDEVSLDCWKKDASIQEWMKEHGVTDETGLFDYFESKLLDIVSDKIGKRTVVWQEVFNLGLSLRNDTIVDVWKGFDEETIQQATEKSLHVIVSGCWYLDHLGDGWRRLYECVPRSFNGTDAQKELVMGGHASMWGESVDASNFMSRVWPRASAAAERLWRGEGAEVSVEERMHRFRCQMVGRGVMAGPVGPGSCERETVYRTGETPAELASKSNLGVLEVDA